MKLLPYQLWQKRCTNMSYLHCGIFSSYHQKQVTSPKSRVQFGFHYLLFKGILFWRRMSLVSCLCVCSCGCRRLSCSQMRPSSTLNHPNRWLGTIPTAVAENGLQLVQVACYSARADKQTNWKIYRF